MADDKKKPAAAPSAPSRTTFEEIVFFLAGLLLLAVIINQLMAYLNSLGWNDPNASWSEILKAYFWPFWSVWKVIVVAFSAACLIWAIYNLKKINEIDVTEKKIFGSTPATPALDEHAMPQAEEKKNEKWLRVTEHINSDKEADWRLAIIEADIMLDELLKSLGYQGEGVGEMLKAAEGSEFMNLEAAWEAHKVRNRIAHSGGDFQLNEREAKRAIRLFETVFKEFRII